jgi:hypothetical protein
LFDTNETIKFTEYATHVLLCRELEAPARGAAAVLSANTFSEGAGIEKLLDFKKDVGEFLVKGDFHATV